MLICCTYMILLFLIKSQYLVGFFLLFFFSLYSKAQFEITLGCHLNWDNSNIFKEENPTAGVNLEHVWFDCVLPFILSLFFRFWMRGTSVFVWSSLLVSDFSVAIVRHSLLSLHFCCTCMRTWAVIPASRSDKVCTDVLHIDRIQGYLNVNWSDSIFGTIPRENTSNDPLTRYKTFISFIWYRHQWLYTI